MLSNLVIKNVALIHSLTIDFDGGLNVISGETGSGKSIMLDALAFVFGDRADKSMIRQNCNSMKVSALFIAIQDKVIQKIIDLGITTGDEILLEREYDSNGKNVCRLNGDVISTPILRKVADLLVDIQGQNEQQSIMKKEYQLAILDAFCKGELLPFKDNLNEKIDILERIEKDVNDLGGNAEQKQSLIDLYRYQINEIELAGITDGEYDELLSKKREMQNYEKIVNSLKDSVNSLSNNGLALGAYEQLYSASKNISNISNISNQYKSLADRMNTVLIEVRDISECIGESLSNANFDENEFEKIDNRLDLIKDLFRKYGGDYSAYTNYYHNTKQKLDNLVNSEQKYIELNNEKQKLLKDIFDLQTQISEIRQKYASVMSEKIGAELSVLGMKNAKFSIDFYQSKDKYTRNGFDDIEYMFSANLGFDKKPLTKVISGGEMSRFMLAYKNVVNKIDDINTMIFDEIDAGLSGSMAQTVAQSLKDLSKTKQIIAVSHLPQIASLAETNFVVSKQVVDNTTITNLEKLEGQKLYQEIARLMGLDFNKTENIEFVKNLKK